MLGEVNLADHPDNSTRMALKNPDPGRGAIHWNNNIRHPCNPDGSETKTLPEEPTKHINTKAHTNERSWL